MARRRKNQDEVQENRVPSLTYSTPSQSYSQDALDALAAGNYKDFRASGLQERQKEQARQGYLNKKAWREENDIPSLVNARQYQQNLADQQKLYEYDEAARKANTLEKRDGWFDWDSSDQDYLQRIYDNFGEEGARRALRQSNRTKDWEKKYGKSYDQILNDFLADQKNVTMQMGESHPFFTEAGTIINSVPNALLTLPSLAANLINPESSTAKKFEQMRAENSKKQKLYRAGVKMNTGEKGDKVVDTINSVGDRMVNTIAGNAVGKGLGGVMAGLSDANAQLDDLDLRGVTGRQKYASALAHGAVEGIGTNITSGILDKLPALEGVKGALMNIGKGAGNAAIENAISEAIEMGSDTLINKEQSQKELNKQLYMLQGMSETDAEEQAQADQFNQVKQAALTGALFGGGMRGLTEIGNGLGKIPTLKGILNKAEPIKGEIVDENNSFLGDDDISDYINSGNSYHKHRVERFENGENIVIRSISELKDKIKTIINSPGKDVSEMKEVGLMRVGQNITDQIKALDNDVDTNNYFFQIEPSDLKHTYNQHKNAKFKNDLPMSEDDVAFALSHLNNGVVEKIEHIGKNGKRAVINVPADDGNYISVQVISKGDGALSLKSMWKIKKNIADTMGDSGSFKNPTSIPSSDVLSDSNVEQSVDNVKTNVPEEYRDVTFGFGEEMEEVPTKTETPEVKPTEPKSEPPVPRAEDGDRVRSFSKRGSLDESLPEEIRNTLSEDKYKIVRNADTSARADEMFDPENLAQTHSNLKQAISEHDPASALLSYKLAKAYVDEGNYDAATDVIEEVSKELTRMGQFTQAAKLAMLQNDPMAALRSYMKDLKNLNQWGKKKYKGKWNKLELSQEDIDLFNKVEKGDKEALNAVVDQLNTKFGKQIPANWWDKAVGASKTAMLLNFRTQARNVLANVATLPIRSASDRVSALGQNIVHLFNPDMKVTQSLVGGTAEQKNIAAQIFDRMKDEISGENKMKDSVKSDILSRRQTFDNDALAGWINNLTDGGIEKLNQKFGADANTSTMETLQNLTYWLMGEVGDTPFVKKNFVNRLASYMKAQGINNIEDVPDDAIAIATQEALKATFKDDNAFTKALQGVKEKSGKFGEVALPFVKTPANLTMRAIDYSPAGLINTFRKIKSGAQATEVIDELSKNLTGTAMIYLGYKLAEKGLISGQYSKDKDEASFQKQQGMLEYALHVGDNYYTYDWTQPAATPLVIGTTIYEAVKNSDDDNKKIEDIVNATYKGGLNVANTVLNSSPLQSLADLLGDNGTDDSGIAGNIANELMEFPQRFVPSILGATARTIDPVMRDTYVSDDSLTGAFGNQFRSFESKIPFLSQTLPASYDTWGNERRRSDSQGEAFIAQMVNPGQLGNKNVTPLDNEIQRIFDATGNAAVFPLNAARKLDLGSDGNITLTNKQHSEYQKMMGQTSYKYAEQLMNNADFKSLSDDEKANVLARAYKLSNEMAKEKLFNHTTDSDKKLKEIARTGNAKSVAEYLMDSEKAKALGMNIDTYQKKEAENPGGAVEYAQNKQTADSLGIKPSTYDKILEKSGQYSGVVEQAIPALVGMGLPTDALYKYANAVRDYDDVDPNEFGTTYREIDTDNSGSLKEKELLDYINSFEYDDPSEAEDLWYMFSELTNKKGERKKIKNANGVWTSYY